MSQLRYAILPNVLVPLAGASTDIYLPSLPHMASAFSVSAAHVQLTITSFVMAMAFGQYLAGPVSDALGRKRLIIVSLIVQLFAVTTILLASSMSLIILARAIQGAACAFMIVPARALINDKYTGIELKKKYNYLTMSFAMSPIIAPFVGGYCEHLFGWQSNFVLLLVYASVLLVVMVLFTEETIKEMRKFSFMHIIHNYTIIASRKTFLYPTVFIGIIFGYTSLNNVLGPFIFQNVLGLSAVEYGYVALTFGMAWFLGNSLNRILFDVTYLRKVVTALLVQTTMIAVMLVLSYANYINVVTLLIPLFFIVMSSAMIFSVFVGECMSQFPELAASSNAFLFATSWLGFAAFTLIATFIPADRITPVILVFVVVNVISYLFMCIPTMRRMY